MESYSFIPQVSAAGIVCVAGLVVQSFVIASNINDWLKGGSLTAADQMITSLGVARLVLHSLCLCDILHPDIFIAMPGTLRIVLSVISETSILLSIWFSALLSIIFCMKISNFHNIYFLRLKVIISRKTVHLIALSVLWGTGYTSLNAVNNYVYHPDNSTAAKIAEDIKNSGLLTSIMLLFHILPFIMYFFSVVLLITPLCLHVKRIKSDESMTCRVDTYIKTITFIVVSFLMCAAYIIISAAFGLDLNLDGAEIYIVWNMFPLLHSAYMIYAIGKLRNQLWKVVRLFIRGSKSQSRDPVQRITF